MYIKTGITVESSLYPILPYIDKYYSVQNEGLVFRDPMSRIVYVCRISTRSSFSIVRSTHCCKTLITAKKLDPLRSQTEGYQTPLVYLANRNSIPFWYQKRFLRPSLINFYFKSEWKSLTNILREKADCAHTMS